MRLTQSVVGCQTCRISTYVDDPIIAAIGTKLERHTIFATILLLWACLGLPMAMDKAKLGQDITWTSATFLPKPEGITVRVKPAIVAETLEGLKAFMRANIITRKALRTSLGKSTHIASLVPVIRPFLTEMYGALYRRTNAAVGNTIWTKQIAHAISWLIAFLDESEAKLERTFDLITYRGQGKQVCICLDASPWGLGGFLVEESSIISWFACAIGTEEQEILQISTAESAAQQVVEALVVLVALRGWKHRWVHQRIELRVKSDSISALVLCLNLKTRGHGTCIVAREIALDVAHSEYRPHVAQHIPGVDNIIADALSRKYAPGYTFTMPTCLDAVQELMLPVRGKDYYRTLTHRAPAAAKRRRRQIG